MKYHNLLTIFFFSLLIPQFGYPQTIAMQVIGATGGFDTTNNGSSSWTVGEPSIEFNSSQSGSSSQGFQQSWDFLVGAAEQVPLSIEIYPNPTKGPLQIKNGAGFTIRLIDMQGKECSRSFLSSDKASIDLSHFSKGIYSLLFLSPEGATIFGKKLVKN